jgi:hypothetical protein
MIRNIGRAQMIGIVAILALFFLSEITMHGFEPSPRELAQAPVQSP